MEKFEAGDVIEWTFMLKHYVYELIDPRGVIFYVGMTLSPVTRFRVHESRTDLAVGRRMAEAGGPCKMRINSVHELRSDAEVAEISLIKSHLKHRHPLINQIHTPGFGHTVRAGLPG